MKYKDYPRPMIPIFSKLDAELLLNRLATNCTFRMNDRLARNIFSIVFCFWFLGLKNKGVFVSVLCYDK
jgi:hypothetical protein